MGIKVTVGGEYHVTIVPRSLTGRWNICAGGLCLIKIET